MAAARPVAGLSPDDVTPTEWLVSQFMPIALPAVRVALRLRDLDFDDGLGERPGASMPV